MPKIHLRRNKSLETETIAACATNPYVNKARRNARQTYQGMSSEVVGWNVFKTMDSKLLCSHCIEAALVIRNRQRKAKGMSPIANWND